MIRREVVIGDCRLLLGDCLEILPAIGAVNAVVTDPPYGIAWKRGVNHARNSKAHKGILNDEDTSARDVMLASVRAPAAVFGSFYAPYPPGTKQVLIWHKPPDSGLVGSVTGFRRDAEPIFLVGNWPVRTVERSSVLRTMRGQAGITTETGHPHTKPVDLMQEIIALAPPGIVLDPFAGSGSTLVACVRSGRPAIGIEINPEYFETMCRRVEDEVSRPRMFIEPRAPEPIQEAMFPLSDKEGRVG